MSTHFIQAIYRSSKGQPWWDTEPDPTNYPGTYNYTKVLNAHNLSFFYYLTSFEIQDSPGYWYPPYNETSDYDDTLRLNSYNATNYDGNNNPTVTDGSQLLYRGNYAHPNVWLLGVAPSYYYGNPSSYNTNISGNKAYYAGSNSLIGNQSMSESDRTWIEVISPSNFVSGLSLSDGTQYTLIVACGTETSAPNMPSLSVSQTDLHTAYLSWSTPSQGGSPPDTATVDSYEWRLSGGSWTNIGLTTYVYSVQTNGYFTFELKAVNFIGESSVTQNSVTLDPLQSPSMLNGTTGTGSGAIDISFSAASGSIMPSYYELEYNDGGGWTSYGTITSGTTIYLTANTTYDLQVRGSNGSDYSTWTNTYGVLSGT